jgi:hypothetical protein
MQCVRSVACERLLFALLVEVQIEADIDEYDYSDNPYKQLIVWDPQEKDISEISIHMGKMYSEIKWPIKSGHRSAVPFFRSFY